MAIEFELGELFNSIDDLAYTMSSTEKVCWSLGTLISNIKLNPEWVGETLSDPCTYLAGPNSASRIG